MFFSPKLTFAKGTLQPQAEGLAKAGRLGCGKVCQKNRGWLTPSWPTPAGTIRELNIGLGYKSRGGDLVAVVGDGIAEYIG